MVHLLSEGLQEEIVQAPPLISILVNVFNGGKYVEECMESLLSQEGDWLIQVIIVDDASADDTPARLERFAGDPRVTIVRLEVNAGAAAAINHGFSLATGEFLARVDYDDRWKPDFLNRSVPALQASPDAAFLCASVQMIDGDGRSTGLASPAAHGETPGCRDRFASMLRDHFVTAPTILARREHWMRALPVPPGLNACDWYMNLAMAEEAPVVVLDAITADYRVHPANMHATIIHSGDGEAMTAFVLRRFLTDTPRRGEMRPHARSIRAAHARYWADAYFGAGLYPAARRCYLSALRLDFPAAVKAGALHRLSATFLDGWSYRALKQVLRGGATA